MAVGGKLGGVAVRTWGTTAAEGAIATPGMGPDTAATGGPADCWVGSNC